MVRHRLYAIELFSALATPGDPVAHRASRRYALRLPDDLLLAEASGGSVGYGRSQGEQFFSNLKGKVGAAFSSQRRTIAAIIRLHQPSE